MSFIEGLHGVVALVLICILLYVEEAGVPLPTPGEFALILAGVLIATGALDPWLFVPMAVVSCVSGSLTGYSWARLVGEHGLRAAAAALHQTARLERVSGRLRQAAPRDIAVARLIPGLRVYTSLVAGGAGVDLQTFLLGVVPAAIVWVAVFLTLGIVVGVPAERFLGQLEGLVVQGGVLVVIGIVGYFGIRHAPKGGVPALGRLPASVRSVLAAGVDIALLGSVVAGVLAVVRPLTPFGVVAGWLDIVVVIVVIAAFYSVATGGGRRATAGESLLGASYLTTPEPDPPLAGILVLARRVLERSPSRLEPDLTRAAARFRALGDLRRLQVARSLLLGDRSVNEIAESIGVPGAEVEVALRELGSAGLVVVRELDGIQRHALAGDVIRLAVAQFLMDAPGDEASAPGQS